MSVTKKIKLVLAWHMHQPHYRDGLDGQYRLPWVYLHALKDYSDMVAHLENCPSAHVVVNFAPVLLEQLDDYANQIKCWLDHESPMQDEMLNLLAGISSIPRDNQKRIELVVNCMKANAGTMIDPYPEFKKLINMAKHLGLGSDAADLSYLNKQYFKDCLVWYHLVWMGKSVRLKDERVEKLMQKGRQFTPADRRVVLEVMADVMMGIIPRYKALFDSGQIEISMTPYGHPIVPLLIDFDSMDDAQPGAPKPESSAYPEGYERAKWHMEKGLEVFETYFNVKPKGVWLSEGGVSAASVGLLDEYGIDWTASGEGVWRHSCETSQMDPHVIASKSALFQPLQHASQNCRLFFRDDGLSDLIGFQYKDWSPQDAANNFAHHLCNIANSLGENVEEHVVSVILDGENAWEYYPDNAYVFLEKLYSTLAHHEQIEMVTFSEALDKGAKPRHLPKLKAGSWVYGSFSTWIGSEDKNKAWDLLVEAKETFDSVMMTDQLTSEEKNQAKEQMAVCEGSDWFWWFGDYNPSGSVQDFDRLYRRHLERLYQILKKRPPEQLQIPLSEGGGEMDNGGVMQRGVGA